MKYASIIAILLTVQIVDSLFRGVFHHPGKVRLDYCLSDSKGSLYGNRNRRAPTGEINIDHAIKRLLRAKDDGDLEEFVVGLKTVGYKNVCNEDYALDLYPILEDFLSITAERLGAGKISEVIWSMGRLGFKASNSSHSGLYLNLLHIFCEESDLTGREVTTTLGGLARMSVKWNFLSENTREDIKIAIGKVALTLNDREIGNIVHSMTKLLIPWDEFSERVQNDLLQSFVRNSKNGKMLSHQGSMTIYSLGLLGIRIDDVTPAIRDNIFSTGIACLEESFTNIHKSITQQSSNVIYGFMKLGLKWSSLPLNVRTCIERAMMNIMGYMNEQEVANTIYSLGVMGAPWSELSVDIKTIIETTAVQRLTKMIPQGISNTIYGMGGMKNEYEHMSHEYQTELCRAIEKCFAQPITQGSQVVGNIIYSLGLCGVKASQLPQESLQALYTGIERYGPDLKSQEFSNAVYGLGLLRPEYDELPKRVIAALTKSFRRIAMTMNGQEICSTLYGIAKMNAKWSNLSAEIKDCIFTCIQSQRSSPNPSLCLACSVYSLGLLEADWTTLPLETRESLISFSQTSPMKDQTLSNIVYGLSLLNVQWATLETAFKNSITKAISQPDVFDVKNSQHISNTIWGLAKMDASWSCISVPRLEDTFCKVVDLLNPQEICNSIYGFAILDSVWSDLSYNTKLCMVQALHRNIIDMDVQEVSNVMYSLALMTFDAGLSEFDESKCLDFSVSNGAPISPVYDKESLETILWKMYILVLWKYRSIRASSTYDLDISKENYDQFAMFFELMDIVPGGKRLVRMIFDTSDVKPCYSGPSASIPSRLHAHTVQSMEQALKLKSANEPDRFEVFNEFNGMRGILPVDVAVFDRGKLLSFIEIDGETHYKQVNQQLRRKDKYKEHLYKYYYPSAKLFRIKSSQVAVIGVNKAGESLAAWIYSEVSKSSSVPSAALEADKVQIKKSKKSNKSALSDPSSLLCSSEKEDVKRSQKVDSSPSLPKSALVPGRTTAIRKKRNSEEEKISESSRI